MAGLPHYTSSKASVNKYEPIFLNQFEVTITPPTAIPVQAGNPGAANILLEQVTRVSGLQVDQNAGEITQQYKFANPLTGAMGLKKDYTGNILINVFNKQGDIFRKINLRDCFPMTPIPEMALNYTQTSIYKLNLTWAVDYFDDIFI